MIIAENHGEVFMREEKDNLMKEKRLRERYNGG